MLSRDLTDVTLVSEEVSLTSHINVIDLNDDLDFIDDLDLDDDHHHHELDDIDDLDHDDDHDDLDDRGVQQVKSISHSESPPTIRPP